MNAQQRGWLALVVGFVLSLLLSLSVARADDKDTTPGILKPLLTIQVCKEGERQHVLNVHFSPDGKIIATAGGDYLRLWNSTTGKLLRETTIKYDWDGKGKMIDGPVSLYGFLNKGKMLACSGGSSSTIHWLDAETLKIKRSFRCSNPRSNSFFAAVSNDGKAFATIDMNGRLTVWDAESGEQKWEYNFRELLPYLAFSPDGTRLVLAEGTNQTLRVFDAADGKKLFSLAGLRGTRCQIGHTRPTFSPDGQFLLAGVSREPELCLVEARASGVGRLLKWDRPPPTDPCEKKDMSSNSYASVVAFSPDGHVVLACCDDRRLRLFEVATGGMWGDFQHRVFALAFSPDNSVLATAHPSEGKVDLWDWRNSFRHKPSSLNGETAKRLWVQLGSKEATTGRAAMAALLADPKQCLALLAKLEPIAPATSDEVTRLIADLSHEKFAVREKAEKRLGDLGGLVVEDLRLARAKAESKEAEVRLKRLLEHVDAIGEDELQTLRCIEMLERLRTEEARAILKRLAGGAKGAFLTEEASRALARINQPNPSKP